MGAQRKPTLHLIAGGMDKKNPARIKARKNEPKAVGELGNPPNWMTTDQKAIWVEHVAMLPLGVTCQFDRGAFSALVRHAEAARSEKYNRDATTAYLKALGLFGLTPADRSRVAAMNQNKANDEWAEFA